MINSDSEIPSSGAPVSPWLPLGDEVGEVLGEPTGDAIGEPTGDVAVEREPLRLSLLVVSLRYQAVSEPELAPADLTGVIGAESWLVSRICGASSWWIGKDDTREGVFLSRCR